MDYELVDEYGKKQQMNMRRLMNDGWMEGLLNYVFKGRFQVSFFSIFRIIQ